MTQIFRITGPLEAEVRPNEPIKLLEVNGNLVGCGASLADAVWAATGAPARLLGDPELGILRPGAPANITVLDDELRVVRTLVAGAEAFAAVA